MSRKLVQSQITNFKTEQMYLRQMLTLAENVFEFKNVPQFVDIAYLNKCLVRQRSCSFFPRRNYTGF